MDKITAAKKAIRYAGGQTKVAAILAQKYPDIPEDKIYWRIQKWCYNGIPPRYAIALEQLSGVSRKDLCPGVFDEL